VCLLSMLFAGDAGPASACRVSQGLVMEVEAVCKSLRHMIVAIKCRWCCDGGMRRRYDTCIDNGYESRGRVA